VGVGVELDHDATVHPGRRKMDMGHQYIVDIGDDQLVTDALTIGRDLEDRLTLGIRVDWINLLGPVRCVLKLLSGLALMAGARADDEQGHHGQEDDERSHGFSPLLRPGLCGYFPGPSTVRASQISPTSREPGT